MQGGEAFMPSFIANVFFKFLFFWWGYTTKNRTEISKTINSNIGKQILITAVCRRQNEDNVRISKGDVIW